MYFACTIHFTAKKQNAKKQMSNIRITKITNHVHEITGVSVQKMQKNNKHFQNITTFSLKIAKQKKIRIKTCNQQLSIDALAHHIPTRKHTKKNSKTCSQLSNVLTLQHARAFICAGARPRTSYYFLVGRAFARPKIDLYQTQRANTPS